MTYASATIGSVLDEVNRTYFLPAIQRPFVWTPHQVITLFDSLMKGYGRHSALKPMRQLANADLICFTIERPGEMEMLLEGFLRGCNIHVIINLVLCSPPKARREGRRGQCVVSDRRRQTPSVVYSNQIETDQQGQRFA